MDQSVRRIRMPTCDEVDECEFRPEPEKDPEDGERTVGTGELCDLQTETVEDRPEGDCDD